MNKKLLFLCLLSSLSTVAMDFDNGAGPSSSRRITEDQLAQALEGLNVSSSSSSNGDLLVQAFEGVVLDGSQQGSSTEQQESLADALHQFRHINNKEKRILIKAVKRIDDSGYSIPKKMRIVLSAAGAFDSQLSSSLNEKAKGIIKESEVVFKSGSNVDEWKKVLLYSEFFKTVLNVKKHIEMSGIVTKMQNCIEADRHTFGYNTSVAHIMIGSMPVQRCKEFHEAELVDFNPSAPVDIDGEDHPLGMVDFCAHIGLRNLKQLKVSNAFTKEQLYDLKGLLLEKKREVYLENCKKVQAVKSKVEFLTEQCGCDLSSLVVRKLDFFDRKLAEQKKEVTPGNAF